MTITLEKKYLIDTNILIYSQDKKSPKNKRALETLDELEEKASNVFLTVQNLLEYSAVFSRHYKISKKEIAKDIEIFTSNFQILYPNETVVKVFIAFLNKDPRIYVHDLFLVAYMKTFGLDTIITDDNDFKEIKGIEVLNPF